jgi:hypothetical protein
VFSFAAELPYSNCRTNQRVIQFVGEGGRMSRPTTELLPDSLWAVAQSLWAALLQRSAARAIRKQAIPEASEIDTLEEDNLDMHTALYVRLN